ncbi:MAG: hypothetical protein ACI8PP_000858 [Candidatus Pseudothioglobus sp.]|jgi:uncharacterized protein YciI
MMRWLSTTFALGCLSFSGAAAEDSPNFYLLEYVAGVNWQQGLDFDDQRNSRAHYAYLEKLYANNILMMSGPLDNSSGASSTVNSLGAMVLISATSAEQAVFFAQADPLHQAHVVRINVRGWRVFRSRMMSGKRRLAADDKIAPYIIKRLSPDAAINIDTNEQTNVNNE